MKSKIKKEIYRRLVPIYKKNHTINLIHSVGLYLCLKENLDILQNGVYICSDGQNIGKVKHFLKLLLGSDFEKIDLHIFGSLRDVFSKKNIADRLAYKVNKRRQKETIKLTLSHFDIFLNKK